MTVTEHRRAPHHKPRRPRLRKVGAVLAAVTALITVLWPAWIEAMSGIDPDRGSGAAEVAVVAALASVVVALCVPTVRHYRAGSRPGHSAAQSDVAPAS